MDTLIISDTYGEALKTAEEIGIENKDFGHLSARISPTDVINSHAMRGRLFGRIIYLGKRPSDEVTAYLSIFMRDGAFLTSYKNYKLKKTLESL